MNPAQFITHLRHKLDDPTGLESKVGVQWTDDDILRQLDASQDEIVRLAHELGQRWKLTRLLSLQSVTVTQDRTRFSLNNDYFLPGVVTHNGKAGRIMQMREAVHYEASDHFGIQIEGREGVVTGLRGGTALFWYYRNPVSFTLNPVVQRRELPEMLYKCVRQHAAAMLARKDAGNSRFEKPLREIVRQMLLTKSPKIQIYAEDVA